MKESEQIGPAVLSTKFRTIVIVGAIGLLLPGAQICSAQCSLTPSDAKALNTNAAFDSVTDDRADIATDGVGTWLAAWQWTDAPRGFFGNGDILISRSLDNGSTWTAPTALSNNAGSGDINPRLATDGQGNWVAVWYSDDSLGGTIGSDADILVSRSSDNGVSWTDPVALNTNAGTDSGPDFNPLIATDRAGTWVVVWYSRDPLGGTIGTDADVLVSRSTDNGLSWTPPVPLNTDADSDSDDDISSAIATDRAGTWVTVWGSGPVGGVFGDDFDIFFSRSVDNGASWTDPAPLDTNGLTDTGFDGSAGIDTDGAGNWVAAWVSDDSLEECSGMDQDIDILVARSQDNGISWTAPAPLNTNAYSEGADDRLPQVTTDRAGNWVAVWHSDLDVNDTVGDDNILFARSVDNGASWTSPAPLNTNAKTDVEIDSHARVATDGAGHWVVVWTSDDPLGDTLGVDTDILTASFTICRTMLQGDLDGDCDVDLHDYGIMQEQFNGPSR